MYAKPVAYTTYNRINIENNRCYIIIILALLVGVVYNINNKHVYLL